MVNCSLLLIVVLIFLSNSYLVQAAYEDARCKCLCIDESGSHDKTKPIRKVFVKATSADKCTCKVMLGPQEESLCPYCECKYQVRNTTTIKVVVCLILVVISALTIYMIFLLLLEPLLSSRCPSPKTPDVSGASISSTASTSDGLVSRKQTSLQRHLSNLVAPFTIFKKRSSLVTVVSHEGRQHRPMTGDRGIGDNAPPGKISPDVSGIVWGRSGWSAEQLLPDFPEDSAGPPEVGGYLHQRLTSISREQAGKGVNNETVGQVGTSPYGRLSTNWPGAALADVAGPSSMPSATGVSTVVNRVRDQQQRWKGNVEAQRARVFSEHTLLN